MRAQALVRQPHRGRWSQAGGCKQSVRGRQREAQAAGLTCRNAGGQELLSRPTSRKGRTGRHRGRQKRQGSTVGEVSTCTQKQGEGREAGRQRLTERSKLQACK
jgi:hypothetical protein